MIGTFENLQAAKEGRQEQEPEVRWNIPQKEDWEKYKEVSEAASKDIEKVFEDKNTDIEEVMTKIDAIQTKIKFAAHSS